VEQLRGQLRIPEFVNIFHGLFIVAQTESDMVLEKDQSKAGTLFLCSDQDAFI
jgi:hypothetical protein